jgi:hypothetical protein
MKKANETTQDPMIQRSELWVTLFKEVSAIKYDSTIDLVKFIDKFENLILSQLPSAAPPDKTGKEISQCCGYVIKDGRCIKCSMPASVLLQSSQQILTKEIKPEDMLVRGKGNFIHCTDYEDAIKAMHEYANQSQNIREELIKFKESDLIRIYGSSLNHHKTAELVIDNYLSSK